MACRIFMSSISLLSELPIPMSKALEIISENLNSLSFWLNFFESFILDGTLSKSNITAAEITGPASAPLPTSSIPHIFPLEIDSISFSISKSLYNRSIKISHETF